MIVYGLSIICGTALAFWGNSLIDPFWISFFPVLLFLAWLTPVVRKLCLVIAAMLWASLLLTLTLDQRLVDDFGNRIVLLQGTVVDIPEQRTNSTRFYLEPDAIESYSGTLPHRIRLNWYRSQQRLQAGQRWQLEVKLRQPRGFRNPGAFDYERWLFVKRIGATGYVRKSADNKLLSQAGWANIDQLRERIVRALDRACSECRYSGLFKALSVGYRGDIPGEQGKLLRETGTAHLLAISGLHIGLVAGQFYLLGGFLWRRGGFRTRFNRLEFSAVSAVLAAIVYSALAGFSIPTVRALIMLLAVFLSLMLRTKINLLNSILLAISLILLVDPAAIGDASFWLSICALMVIAFGQFLIGKQKNRLMQMLTIQLLFSLLFVPLSILLFDQASPAGFLANIVAIPLLGIVILPLTLIAVPISLLDGTIAGILLHGVDQITDWLLRYLQFLQTSVLPAWSFADRPGLLLASLAVALVILLLPVGWRARIAPMVLLLIVLSWHHDPVAHGDFRMTVLDVGMGTSVVLETRNHSLVYDFGPGRAGGFNAGDWILRPYLQFRGVRQADLMIVSHVDSDHSGGLIGFIDEIENNLLISGDPPALRSRYGLAVSVPDCHDYPPWRWDGVAFEFIAVSRQVAQQTSNNRSCILKVSGRHSALLTGDIEADQERWLVETSSSSLRSDILLAPHHGSLTSSTDGFIDAVDSAQVIFTVGRNNRWGFPKLEILTRYRRQGSRIYRSDFDGAITLLSTQDSLLIERSRKSARIWHEHR